MPKKRKNHDDPEEEYASLGEVARYLRIGTKKLRMLVKEGEIETEREEGKERAPHRFSWQAVKDFLARHTTNANKEENNHDAR